MDMKRVRFFTQTGISLSVMGFCMAMLATGEKTEIYLPVLTGIVGYWLPQPSAKRYGSENKSNNITQSLEMQRIQTIENAINNV